jgi:bifunctional non-homologous end joining protein LigD
VAFKTGGHVHLRSRNDNDFTRWYGAVTTALQNLPDESVIDGEIVALDEAGRPSFNLLQNHGSTTASILYYVFDVMALKGRDVMGDPLTVRRELLAETALKGVSDPIRLSPELHADLRDLIESVKAQGLEGLVAKRRDSRYEPGLRSGAWQKMRVNLSQEFVIGGYTVGGATFDAIIFGHYEGDRLLYVSRTRSGFTPALRRSSQRATHVETGACCTAFALVRDGGGKAVSSANPSDCPAFLLVRRRLVGRSTNFTGCISACLGIGERNRNAALQVTASVAMIAGAGPGDVDRLRLCLNLL